MKRILVLLTSASILLASCSQKQAYEKTSDGVVINITKSPNGLKRLRLQVVNDQTIHVSATAADNFSDEKSLIAVTPTNSQSTWDATQNGDTLTLTTAKLKALVSLSSGEISYLDAEGNPIISEDSKSFTPTQVDGTNGYTIQQKFNTPEDEGLYGLGQHQADEFNYKGKNEILFQYNTKVSVPFIISSKNYGILWDNYSVTKFGDARDYSQMNQFKLYDKSGKEGGLTATYLTNSDPDSVFCERTETVIDYENLETVKNFPKDFKFYNSTIVWEGEIEPSESGLFRFILYYAGYTKVYLNNELVVPERWRTAWNPNSYKFSKQLEQGKRTPFKIEWKPDGGISYISMKALSPVLQEEQNKIAFTSEFGNQIDYYFIHGTSMDEVISGYRNITGKAQIMPSWAMGFWQSRERYKTQDEIVGALAEFRKRQIPIDNIVMDWSYWKEDQWGSHEFDPERFSDPSKMIQDIHDMNGHIMISVWPKFYINTEHYKALDAKGFIYQQAVKDSIRDWIAQGYIGSFYDPYSQEARDMFWGQMKEKLYDIGIDAWWMDASEPDIQSNSSIEYRKKLCTPTALGPSTKYFNTYALMNAQAIYEGQRKADNDKRVFLLTRSGFAGLQRYSTATWSGDIGTRWEDMKAQISAGMNFALSGIPYWTMDIGGFCVEHRYEQAQIEFNKTKVENADLKEWRELNTRWYQFGTFAPLFRAHGQFPYREVYNIAPESHPAYKSIVYYDKLRYRLMPYIYSLAGMTHFSDYTIMRALPMDFANDKNVLNVCDQYMFGTALMICPVYKYEARTREVYMPTATTWYDLYSGKVTANGKQTVEAPYERMPIFVKAGAIIPFGADIQYVGEKPADKLTVYIYGGADGTFELYEDEGINYNYEKGAFAKIRFTYNDADNSLTIADREGQFEGMLKDRTITIVKIDKDHAQSLDPDAKGIEVTYDGTKQIVKL